MEVGAAQVVAAQQNPPPPLGQGTLVVKELEGQHAVIGQSVVDCRAGGWELGVEGVFGPEGVCSAAWSGDFHQRVGQVICLEGNPNSCNQKALHQQELSVRA